jgi:hypothetical protein
LLNQSPHFRTRRADLLGKLGAADNHGGVLREQPYDSPQTRIRLGVYNLTVWRGRPRPRAPVAAT